MKVGIITFHRAYNYGAVLQCYALQQVICSMGHDVEIIDYRQPYIESKYKPEFSIRKSLSLFFHLHLGGLKKYIKDYHTMSVRSTFFHSFCDKFLKQSAPCDLNSIPQHYDRYIIGSDQMWGLHCTGGYDAVYWGDFKRPDGSKLYGYAISTNLKYHDILSDEQIITAVKHFDGLSFREQDVRDDIEKTTGVHGVVSIDPTLLTSPELWTPMIKEEWANKKFVALYLLRCNKEQGVTLRTKAKQYATEHGCDVIDLTSMKYSVEDFVSIIKYAQCVFTTSFHATVFSVIFNRPFYSFKLHDGHDGRYENLLRELNLTNHLINYSDYLNEIKEESETEIESNLRKLQQTSIDYLTQVFV